MNQPSRIRCAQHLLVQGITVYPCHAAVCIWLGAPQVLSRPDYAWAVEFDAQSLFWTTSIPESDQSRVALLLREGAIRASDGTSLVLCHVAGDYLLVPMEVNEVRGIRLRIEAAVIRGKPPSPEKLEAFSDEMLEAELAKRGKQISPVEDSPVSVVPDSLTSNRLS